MKNRQKLLKNTLKWAILAKIAILINSAFGPLCQVQSTTTKPNKNKPPPATKPIIKPSTKPDREWFDQKWVNNKVDKIENKDPDWVDQKWVDNKITKIEGKDKDKAKAKS